MANTKIKTLNQVASQIAMLVPQSMLLKRRALPVLLANTKTKTINPIALLVALVRLRKMQQRFVKLVKRANTSTTKSQRNTNARVVLLVNMQ